MFGFSKLDVMFGHAEAHATRMPYTNFAKPGVRLVQQTVVKIDPAAKRVTTDTETHAADHLVVALGADYDWEATPPQPTCTNSIPWQEPKDYETSLPILRAATRW